jgi:hypothetical protein
MMNLTNNKVLGWELIFKAPTMNAGIALWLVNKDMQLEMIVPMSYYTVFGLASKCHMVDPNQPAGTESEQLQAMLELITNALHKETYDQLHFYAIRERIKSMLSSSKVVDRQSADRVLKVLSTDYTVMLKQQTLSLLQESLCLK